MAEFLISIAVFLIAHVVPPSPPVRTRLISWWGRRNYLIAYSTTSIVLLGWMIVAAQRAPYVPFWGVATWQWFVPIIVMPFAFWFLLSGLAEPNPLSISLRKRDLDVQPGLAATVTRHPVLWGFLLWAGSHIPPNGDLVSLVLFGGMALLAIGGVAIVDRRAKRRLGEVQWRELAAHTSLIPFVAIVSGRASVKPSRVSVLILIVAGAIYFWMLVSGHALLIGPDPLAGL